MLIIKHQNLLSEMAQGPFFTKAKQVEVRQKEVTQKDDQVERGIEIEHSYTLGHLRNKYKLVFMKLVVRSRIIYRNRMRSKGNYLKNKNCFSSLNLKS
jgi:hypothetical protein